MCVFFMVGHGNDKTSSVFVTKDKYAQAARDVGLDQAKSDALWAALAEGSSQRIIGGTTAPREDAANVNQWHWAELDLHPWAKERLTDLIVGLEATGVPDKGWLKVAKLEECEGEASVSNRKGKRIVAYEVRCVLPSSEPHVHARTQAQPAPRQRSSLKCPLFRCWSVRRQLKVKFEWKGQVDYDDVSGELLLPYVSEDVEHSMYQIMLTAKDPKDDSHKKAITFLERTVLPTLKEKLKKFTAEIYTK